MEPTVEELTKINRNSTSYNIHGIKANRELPAEQDVDLVITIQIENPVSILTEPAQHLAGKSFFSGCSFAPRLNTVLKMADKRSMEKTAFNFTSKMFADKRISQVFSRSLLAFSSFKHECWTQLSKLTKVLKMWTILELQPEKLRILPRTFGQSSSAFANYD